MNRIASLCLLLVLPIVSFAQVNALPPTRHILVYGEAQGRAVPDRFEVSIEFSAVDVDAGAARERVEAALRSVLARARASGVADGGLTATSMSIGPSERYDDQQRRQVFEGTRVERSLSAEFARKEDLERFLSGLQTSKELRVSEVETRLSSEQALRSALRVESIAETKRKADVIAKAYGARLGALYSVSDVAPQFEYGINEGSWPALFEWTGSEGGGELDRVMVTGSRIDTSRHGGAVALEAGQVTFTDRIYAVFLLAD